MSAQPFQIVYNHSLSPLEKILETVKRPGDYCCSGVCETPLPKISVKGVGVLSFPVPPEQARKVVEQAAEQAPYGRGDKTLVDVNIRKVWQISPDKLEIQGKGWEREFKALLATVESGLGCETESVTAELYKMLVYDPGGHFAPHRDTEKAPGMFGTLVVTLPSAHEGGDLIIRHQGREVVVSLSGDDPGEVHYAAFYADCEHEVRPVVDGYRVCLVYNLISTLKSKSVEAPDNEPSVVKAAEVLRQWSVSGDAPLKLVYLLEHHYTQAALSWTGLKSSDAARASVLHEAAVRAECVLHLGMVHIEESGWADYNQNYRGGRFRHYGEEDEEDAGSNSEYEVGEVCDSYYYIDQWRTPQDLPMEFGELPLEDEEILPAGSLEGEDSDDVHFSEATGNAGMSFERTYLRAALVIWPEHKFDEICISAGLEAAIARLGQLVDLANSAGETGAAAARKSVVDFTRKLRASWRVYDHLGLRLAAMFSHLARFADADLLWSTQEGIPLQKEYDGRLNQAFAACAGVLSAHHRVSFFAPLFEGAKDDTIPALLQLWQKLASLFSAQEEVLMVTLASLTQAALRARKAPTRWTNLPHSSDSQYEKYLAAEKRFCGDEIIHTLTANLLADFVATASVAAGALPTAGFIDALTSNVGYFLPDSIVFPCLEELLNRESVVGTVVTHFWVQSAAALLRRSPAPPVQPTDWAQAVTIPGAQKNVHLRELEAFARDPKATVHRVKARQDLRDQVERASRTAGLDMSYDTDRKGSPQTLVCTKTRATYEAARHLFEKDHQQMRRLLALRVESGLGVKETIDALKRALEG